MPATHYAALVLNLNSRERNNKEEQSTYNEILYTGKSTEHAKANIKGFGSKHLLYKDLE